MGETEFVALEENEFGYQKRSDKHAIVAVPKMQVARKITQFLITERLSTIKTWSTNALMKKKRRL